MSEKHSNSTPKPKRECEDCGEECAYRRYRCKDCQMLVCGWCMGHVHSGSLLSHARKEAEAKHVS